MLGIFEGLAVDSKENGSAYEVENMASIAKS
jgi:hypothetical protein